MGACACGVAAFALLLQRNAPGPVVLWVVVIALALGFAVEPLGLFFRARLQEAVGRLNRANQSLLTQVGWVNEMGRNLGKLTAVDAGLGAELERVEVQTEAPAPWLAKFRADQLRIAAAFLPGVGPATVILTMNFRLGERGRFRGLGNLLYNLVQFAGCAFAVWWALFFVDTAGRRRAFWAVFAIYVAVTLPEFFDDVQDFTLESYRLRWKEFVDRAFCLGKGAQKSVSEEEALVGSERQSYTLESGDKEAEHAEGAEEVKADAE